MKWERDGRSAKMALHACMFALCAGTMVRLLRVALSIGGTTRRQACQAGRLSKPQGQCAGRSRSDPARDGSVPSAERAVHCEWPIVRIVSGQAVHVGMRRCATWCGQCRGHRQICAVSGCCASATRGHLLDPALLPSVCWPPGVHRVMGSSVSCSVCTL